MNSIKCLVENIQEELEGAEHYAKLAVQNKDLDRILADTYYKLAGVELDHVNALHEQVIRRIKAHKASGNEAPAAMMAVWEWAHEKMISHVTKIKILLDQYKA